MSKFTNEDIKELQRYFTTKQPKFDKIPDVKGFDEGTPILVVANKVNSLYVLINGIWKKVQDIT